MKSAMFVCPACLFTSTTESTSTKFKGMVPSDMEALSYPKFSPPGMTTRSTDSIVSALTLLFLSLSFLHTKSFFVGFTKTHDAQQPLVRPSIYLIFIL